MSDKPQLQEQSNYRPTYISTGIKGLDTVLNGGFLKGGFYLLEGDPGSGKTTVGLQYLLKRAQEGERVLYFAFAESRRDMEMICGSHRWSLEKIELRELGQAYSNPVDQSTHSIFDPGETDLEDLIQTLVSEITRVNPSHVVLDGLSELRMLAGTPLRYRRQLLSLKLFSEQRHLTMLLLDNKISDREAFTHQPVVGATIRLEVTRPLYGRARRRLTIEKVRSSEFQEGYHDYEIISGGVCVYPRVASLQASTHFKRTVCSSGLTNLDEMFKGGLVSGTASVFIGPSGVGKSTAAMQFVTNALKQGLKAAVYTFDEVLTTFLERSEKLNWGGQNGALKPYLQEGRLRADQIDPAEITPGAFAQRVRDVVDEGASLVVIDSLNGYINAMPEERFLSAHLHELVSYLNKRNVVTILVVAQHGVLRGSVTDFNISYLADSVLLFRYFESNDEIQRGLTVFKNRTGAHEHTMRQLSISDTGISIGEPISGLARLATGPLYEDAVASDPSLYTAGLQGS
jgi:circadian clock protein KaiC